MTVTRRTVLRTATAAGALAVAPFYARRSYAQSGAPVVYWGHNYPSRVQIVNEIMVPGAKKDLNLDVQHEDFETNQLELKISTAWSGGSSEGPDLVSIGANNLPSYVYRKLIAPVDPSAFGFSSQDELVAAFEPGALESFMVDGTLYGMPMDVATISMYYRKDMFEAAGLDPEKPPTNWDEVRDMGRKLVQKDGNGNITRAGWAWEARSISSHFYYWGTLLPQKGVDFLNADGTANGFDNDGGMAAFQYLYDSFNDPEPWTALGLAPTISPVDDFGAGRVAMLNSGLWLAPSMEQKYPDVTFDKGVYGVARLPQFTDGTPATRLNPWVYMVSSKSDKQSEAWKFVAYMTQRPEARKVWFEKAQFVLPWKGYRSGSEFDGVPYVGTFLDDLSIGVPLPRTPNFTELATAVAKAYDRISANGEKPEAVVPDLASDVDFIVG